MRRPPQDLKSSRVCRPTARRTLASLPFTTLQVCLIMPEWGNAQICTASELRHVRIQFHPKTRLTSITGAIERLSQPYKLHLAPPQLRRERQLLPGRHCIAKASAGPRLTGYSTIHALWRCFAAKF
ncbi:uncharacterized protein SETTUDRAFT_154184 [Exserohilum turcica Et28A]|uniref:Uncharacterized protein n=1 Tax=Exserohilum turcicum (strain 28A) TaxID=671987 RepID=R0IH13_EXST2|nr:uncharacterized protein SETTUDRAFT_154184 [Exserohilum turcica Et28A]EOA84500.1 hypothetical protein SETTUDRAFT_154184 [Exserohilum turcica Et28A]